MTSPLDKTTTDPDPPVKRLTPTEVDSASPFDSTMQRLNPTIAESDPPTALVRRDSCVELPPGSVVDDVYEVDAKIGAGAMGEVYAARHIKLDKRVAIKVIGRRLSEDAAAIERFAMEARTLAKIQHPAIVTVDHVGELADGRAYFVMEYLRGESLLERGQRGRVPLPEALRILDQIARGLEAAHAQGVIHRDLKPENIYLVHLPDEAPIIKLLDFGLMKLITERTDVDCRAESTQSGVAIGTPMYMSPEQARGPDVDHRTDIYALGCIAYELLLGSRPFPHAKTAPEQYAAHLHATPPLPRSIWVDIPPQLDLVLFAMLAKDPEHRPTLAQIRSVLVAVRTSTPSQRAKTELVMPRPLETRRRIWGRSIAIAFAITVLLVGIVIGKLVVSTRETPIVPPIPTLSPPIVPAAPTVMIDAPIMSPPRREMPDEPPKHSTRPVSRPRPPKTSRTTTTAPVPADGGIDAIVVEPDKTAPKPSKPIDKNQTINPFAKRRKVNP